MERETAAGRDVPAFLKRPDLEPGLDFYMVAFNELSTCRQMGMSVGPIPWDAVQAYADSFGLDDETADTLLRMVRALDAAFLAHVREKK